MDHSRFSSFFRLTALSTSMAMFMMSLAPLAHAQAPTPAAPTASAPPKAATPTTIPEKIQPAPAPGGAANAPSTPAAKPATAAKAPDKKTRDAARKAYGQGEKAFADGKYAEAHDAFTKANELIPTPNALYWIAKSLDKQDKPEEAVAAYERLLADPDASRAGEEKIADAKTRVEELKLRLVNIVNVSTVPAGAVVTVDGAPEPGTTPLMLKLTPGPHKLTVSATGFETKEVTVEAKGGEKTDQNIELAPKPQPAPPPPAAPLPEPVAAPPPPPPAPEHHSKVPAYVTLGIAVAGAAVGTVFGIKALSAKSDFNDRPTTSRADDAERNALISDMAFGVAITLGVTGIVLLTSDDDASKETTVSSRAPSKYRVEFDSYANKHGGGATARMRF